MITYESKELNHQAGVTLMELIAALAIMAVIIVGALSLYNSASTSQASTQMVQDTTALRGAVKSLYMGQGSFNGISNTLLIGSKRVPATIKISGNTLTHQLNGGTITVAAAGTNDEYYTITLTQIPQDICVALMSSAQGWYSVTGIAGGATEQTTMPIPVATAITQCTNAGLGTFVFKGN